jgi:hypothetical protein
MTGPPQGLPQDMHRSDAAFGVCVRHLEAGVRDRERLSRRGLRDRERLYDL